MKRWIDSVPINVPSDLLNAVGGHPIIAESLVRRGIHDVDVARQFLNPDIYVPSSASELPDMDQAVSRLNKAIRNKEQILVWGDFDVDGQTSTALLVSGLRDLGAQVKYHVPNRFKEGHGIFLPTFKKLLDGGIDLVVTCDTGISAHKSIDYAKQEGVDVIITDHHTLPETLPNADAVINPMRLVEGHPLRELPGVGTAYKVLEALYGKQSPEHLLDLVAMGIVADVMVQVDDTRYLLQRGLEVLRNSPRAGLKAMMERADINPQDLTETDIGFSLAPRLNALGRLVDANPAVELLTTDNQAVITELVNELEGLNQKRKYLSIQVYAAAQQQIQQDESLLKYSTLVVSGEAWHPGVVGIVASRLAEDYARPVIVLSENDGILSGSARSVTGVNIVESIGSQAELLNSFGGHNMAAGLSLDASNLFTFRRGLSQIVRETTEEIDIEPELAIDAYIPFNDINLEFADDISRLAPFGNGNPPLTLATKNVRVKSRRTMGSRGDHLDLRLVDDHDNEQRVVWWFGDIDAIPDGKFDIAYTVRANTFKGKRDAMVEWLDIRPAEGESISVSSKPAYEIIDYRHVDNPEHFLKKALRDYNDVLIWSDGLTIENSSDRYNLHEAKTLIVWSIPPTLSIWKAALNIVQPEKIILFGQQPAIKTAKDLITTVIGLAKYAHKNKAGVIYLSELVTLTNQADSTITACIKWINANTEMRFIQEDDNLYWIRFNADGSKDVSIKQLSLMLKETAAYQEHWLRQDFS